MPPPSNKHANILRDVVPKNHLIFNPWNSASTGHQRAESSYSSTSEWRTTRTEKLSYQFGKPMTNGSGDGTLDGGAQGRGEWRWMTADEAERRRLGCGDIRTLMGGVKKRKAEGDGDDGKGNGNGRKRLELGASSSRSLASVPSSAQAQNQDSSLSSSSVPQHGRTQSLPHSQPQPPLQSKEYKPRPRAKLAFCSSKTNPNPNSEPSTEKEVEPSNPPGIFTGTTIFINGSTFPLISDHKLKHLLASNGANITILIDHKTVTHVVMGKPNGNGPGGAGGGLAAAKLQRELQRRGSKSVRFVGVEWYVPPSPLSFLLY